MIALHFIIQVVPQKLKYLFVLIARPGRPIYFITEQKLWNSPIMNYRFRSMAGLILMSVFLAVFIGGEIKKHGLIKSYDTASSVQLKKLVSLSLFLANFRLSLYSI